MRALFIVLAALLHTLGATAHASQTHAPPTVQSVEDAGILAHEIFDRLNDPILHAQTRGVQNARRAARTPVQRLSINAAPGIRLTDNAELEHELDSTLWFELGPRTQRAQRAWEQADSALQHQNHADRWLFVTEAERRFAQWWAKQAIASHLQEDLLNVQNQIERWRQQLKPWLTELDLLDLDAETARLSAEVAEALLDAQHAESAFREHMTIEVRMILQEEPDASLQRAGQHNPWLPLLSTAHNLPEVRALHAQAATHHARSQTHKRQNLELGIGARARFTPRHNVLLNPLISLEIPLAPSNPEEAAIESAEAVALQAKAQWKAQTLRAWLQSEADHHNTLVQALALLNQDAIGQLQIRVDRLTQAFEAQHVDVRRVFWALRDLHEVEHKALLLQAELAASETAAAGLQLLLHEDLP